MRFELSPTLRWVLLALAGLAVAVAVGIAASSLTSQRIGLSSEPLQAGEALAPKPSGATGPHGGGKGGHGHPSGNDGGSQPTTTTGPETTTAPETTTTPSTTGDDSSAGESEGEGSEDD